MGDDVNDIDNLFHAGLDAHRETPSPEVWEQLSSDLDKEEIAAYKKKYVFAKRIAVLLLLLFLSYLVADNFLRHSGSGSLADRDKVSGTGKTPTLPGADEETHKNISGIRDRQYPTTDDKTADITGTTRYNVSPPEEATLPDAEAAASPISKKHSLPANSNPASEKSSTAPIPAQVVAGRVKNIAPQKNNSKRRISRNERDILVNNLTSAETEAVALKQPPINEHTHIPAQRVGLFTGNLPVTGIDSAASFLVSRDRLQDPFRQKRPLNRGWTFTVLGSAEVPKIYAKDEDGSIPMPVNVRELEEKENEEPSFSGGVLASYPFNRKFSFQTGLLYTTNFVSVRPQQVYAVAGPGGETDFKINLTSGFAYIKPGAGQPLPGDSLKIEESHSTLEYIGIPVLINFSPGSNRLNFSPSLGITANLLTRGTLETEIRSTQYGEQEYKTKLNGLKKFTLGLYMNTAIRYRIRPKISLSFIPSFRYALTPITKNTGIKSYPYSIGAGMGLIFSL